MLRPNVYATYRTSYHQTSNVPADFGFPSMCCEYVCYHWLIMKLLWPREGQNIARQEVQRKIQRERRWSQGDTK